MFHQGDSWDSLPLLITNNLAYFRDDPTSLSSRYIDALNLMLEHYQWLSVHVDSLCQVVANFDFDEKTQGNGYRSYLYILNSHLNSCWRLCKKLSAHRDSVFFRAEHYLKELEAHTGVCGGLRVTLAYLFKMLVRSKKGELFTCDGHLTATELLQEYCNIDQTGFYGRCHGFYVPLEDLQTGKRMLYVGVTGRSLTQRLIEHKKSLTAPSVNPTSLMQKALENNILVTWEEANIIRPLRNENGNIITEAVDIYISSLNSDVINASEAFSLDNALKWLLTKTYS